MTDKTHDNDLTGPVPGNAGVEANIENMEAMGFDPENLDMILNGTVEGLMSVLFLIVVFLSIETMPISPWMQTSFSITF